jgi:hypothetical protein
MCGTADYFSMDKNYSGDTRVDVTALGWLYLAEEALRMPAKGLSKRKQIERQRQGGTARPVLLRQWNAK